SPRFLRPRLFGPSPTADDRRRCVGDAGNTIADVGGAGCPATPVLSRRDAPRAAPPGRRGGAGGPPVCPGGRDRRRTRPDGARNSGDLPDPALCARVPFA